MGPWNLRSVVFFLALAGSFSGYAQDEKGQWVYDVDVKSQSLLFSPAEYQCPSSAIEVQLRLCGDVPLALGLSPDQPKYVGSVWHFDTVDRDLAARGIVLRFRDRYRAKNPQDRKKPELTLKVRNVLAQAGVPLIHLDPERKEAFQVKDELGLVRSSDPVSFASIEEMRPFSSMSLTYQPDKTWVKPNEVKDVEASVSKLLSKDSAMAEEARCELETFLLHHWPMEQQAFLFAEFQWETTPDWTVEKAYALRVWEWESERPDHVELTLEERTVPSKTRIYELSYKARVMDRFQNPERLLQRLESELPADFQTHAWVCDEEGRALVSR